jgi:hypothetical protein
MQSGDAAQARSAHLLAAACPISPSPHVLDPDFGLFLFFIMTTSSVITKCINDLIIM